MRRLFVLVVLVATAAACRKPVPKIVTPKAIERPLPQPEEVAATRAAQDGKSGSVRVAYCVDTDGKAQDVAVQQPVDPEYDAIAVSTVKQWTFEPATRDGVPYEHCTEAAIEFQP
jgi:TonB family protein